MHHSPKWLTKHSGVSATGAEFSGLDNSIKTPLCSYSVGGLPQVDRLLIVGSSGTNSLLSPTMHAVDVASRLARAWPSSACAPSCPDAWPPGHSGPGAGSPGMGAPPRLGEASLRAPGRPAASRL